MPKKAPQQPVEETSQEEEPKTAFEQFIFHQRKALEETGKALEALLPEGFREHTGEAGKEFVKGFRVLIDAAIDELRNVSEKAEDEAGEGEDKPSTTGKTKVKVQVD
jgi:hypothetical protein